LGDGKEIWLVKAMPLICKRSLVQQVEAGNGRETDNTHVHREINGSDGDGGGAFSNCTEKWKFEAHN